MSALDKGHRQYISDSNGDTADVTDGAPGHNSMGLVVRPVQSSSAFGEMSVAENTSVYQSNFVYASAHPALHRVTEQANGVVSFSNQMCVCSSGNTALGLAALSSQRSLKYRAGQGSMIRFTALFSTPNVGSVQSIGLSNGETGLLLGYFFGTNFTVRRQYGGAREVRTLTVTVGSSHSENITITLEGVAVTVAVTNTGSTTRTAWEIAQGAYSTVNSVGYDVYAEGATVVFVRRQANTVSGAYTLSGATSAVGTFAQTIVGAPVTNVDVAQANFSADPLDGTGNSGILLDPTKGNVFQIDFQYLGFGEIRFWIEGNDGQFVLFHEIAYTNLFTTPSLTNPTISFAMSAYNYVGGAQYATSVKSASVAMFTQGPRVYPHIAYAATSTKSGVGATRTPVLTITPKQVYRNRLFLAEAIMRAASVAVTSTKPVRVEIVVDGTLNNTANFLTVDTNSALLYDTSATSITGGTTIASFTLAKDGQALRELSYYGELFLNRFDKITIVVTPQAANTDIDSSLGWFEDI